jgi:hypothetical protein
VAGLAAALATVTLGLGACNTPFIPIPPPGDPIFTPMTAVSAMGMEHVSWQASGHANAGARVFLYNTKLGVGVIARADDDGGYVSSPFDGQIGDPIEISYETPKGERSAGICRPLQAGLVRLDCP